MLPSLQKVRLSGVIKAHVHPCNSVYHFLAFNFPPLSSAFWLISQIYVLPISSCDDNNLRVVSVVATLFLILPTHRGMASEAEWTDFWFHFQVSVFISLKSLTQKLLEYSLKFSFHYVYKVT